MPSSFGIDIGSRSVTLVELRGSARHPKWVRFDREPVPPGEGVEPLRQAFLQLRRRHKLKGRTVTLNVPNELLTAREITLPFVEAGKIRETIRYQAEQHLFAVNIDDVVLTWAKLRELDLKGRAHARVFFVVTPRERLRALLDITQALGTEPRKIDCDLGALATCALRHPAFEAYRRFVLLDLGATWTNVVLVEERQVVLLRSVRLGVLGHVRRGAESEGQGARDKGQGEEAETLGATAGLPGSAASAGADAAPPPEPPPPAGASSEPPPPLGGRVGVGGESDGRGGRAPTQSPAPADPPAPLPLPDLDPAQVYLPDEQLPERLEKELRRTLTSRAGTEQIERLFLTGGGARVPGLGGYLEARFHIPAERVDLTVDWGAGLPAAVKAVAAVEGAVALGCALKGLGADALPLDFRRDEFRPTPKFEEHKVPLAVAVTLLLFLLMMVAVNQYRRVQRYQEHQAQLDQEAAKAFKRVDSPRKMPEYDADGSLVVPILAKIDALHAKETAPEASFYPVPSVLPRWLAVAEAVQAMKASDQFSISEWRLGETKLGLEGTCLDVTEEQALEVALRAHLSKLPYEVFKGELRIAGDPHKSGRYRVLKECSVTLDKWLYDVSDPNSPIYDPNAQKKTRGRRPLKADGALVPLTPGDRAVALLTGVPAEAPGPTEDR